MQDQETTNHQGSLQNAVLDMFNWEKHWISIDGEHFTDDIIMMAHTPQELEKMLNVIHTPSEQVRLNLRLEKTKVMFNKHATRANTVVDVTTIDQVDSCIYLGRTITHDGNLLLEVRSRIRFGCATIGKGDIIMRSRNTSVKVKKETFQGIRPTCDDLR